MDTRQARRAKGWNQQHLATAAGLDVRTIRRAEAGESMSAETMMAIRAALDVRVEPTPVGTEETPRKAPLCIASIAAGWVGRMRP